LYIYSFSISVLASDKGFFTFASCNVPKFVPPKVNRMEEPVALRGTEPMKTAGRGEE